jgi:hypothetical protein
MVDLEDADRAQDLGETERSGVEARAEDDELPGAIADFANDCFVDEAGAREVILICAGISPPVVEEGDRARARAPGQRSEPGSEEAAHDAVWIADRGVGLERPRVSEGGDGLGAALADVRVRTMRSHSTAVGPGAQ